MASGHAVCKHCSKEINGTFFSGEKPFKCDHCDFRCSRSSSLRTHERRRHGVGLQGGPAAGSHPVADGLTSSVSGNSGASNSNGLNPLSQTNGRSHVCEVCGKAFFTKQTLQVNNNIDSRKAGKPRHFLTKFCIRWTSETKSPLN